MTFWASRAATLFSAVPIYSGDHTESNVVFGPLSATAGAADQRWRIGANRLSNLRIGAKLREVSMHHKESQNSRSKAFSAVLK